MSKGFVRPELIVETAWLAQHLGDPDVRVIDATTHLMPASGKPYEIVSGRADFEKAHIPGAGFIDLDNEVSDASQHPLHFMLPSDEQFAAAMRAHGISDDTLVVTYASANHWWATRLWWMLRVYGHQHGAVEIFCIDRKVFKHVVLQRMSRQVATIGVTSYSAPLTAPR